MKNDTRLRLRIPLYILTKSNLARIVGFRNTIKILKFFSLDKDWANYLINRENSNYYKISKFILGNLNGHNLKILDAGCGTGNLFKELGKAHKVTGVDLSSLSLLLAKYFFARKDDVLLKYDFEIGLPFPNNSFDIVHLNDTFQYLKNKESFIKEARRVLKKNGVLIIVHTHKIKLYKSILGVSEEKLKRLLWSEGFKTVKILSDDLAFFKLFMGDSLTHKSERLSKKNNSEAYTVVASKNYNLDSRFNLSSKRNKYVFVSPHLDDAVLSAGNLITKLRNSGNEVFVVTVFTKCSVKPYSLQAEEHLRNSGFVDAQKLFDARAREDISALKVLDVKYEHLDFVDAAFRRDKQNKFIYSPKTQFSGVVSDCDLLLLSSVKVQLKKIIKSKNSVLVVPLGIGGHVDHVLVRQVVESLSFEKIYWEDGPYNIIKSNVDVFFRHNKNFMKITEISDLRWKKERAVRKYKSQLKSLFPSGVMPSLEEKHYVSTRD